MVKTNWLYRAIAHSNWHGILPWLPGPAKLKDQMESVNALFSSHIWHVHLGLLEVPRNLKF